MACCLLHCHHGRPVGKDEILGNFSVKIARKLKVTYHHSGGCVAIICRQFIPSVHLLIQNTQPLPTPTTHSITRRPCIHLYASTNNKTCLMSVSQSVKTCCRFSFVLIFFTIIFWALPSCKSLKPHISVHYIIAWMRLLLLCML